MKRRHRPLAQLGKRLVVFSDASCELLLLTARALLLALTNWKSDLEELQDAGAPPSRESTLQSLRRVFSGVKDLKLLELM